MIKDMSKRIVWKKGDVVSVKLRDDSFTLAQMLTSPVMRFYAVHNTDNVWEDVDLNHERILFSVFVGAVVLKSMVVDKVKNKTVVASGVLPGSTWIKPHMNFEGGFPWRGGKLIDLGPESDQSMTQAPVLKEHLVLPEDKTIIAQVELTNMWGDKDLADRLNRFFDTGIDRDDLKFEVFPELWDDREALRPLTRRLPEPFR
ncbi:Immunity protein 26 [Pseudomonas chlororaphis]